MCTFISRKTIKTKYEKKKLSFDWVGETENHQLFVLSITKATIKTKVSKTQLIYTHTGQQRGIVISRFLPPLIPYQVKES
ncbi:hypothetical protein PRUPE_4G206500 [Prunus persica]|uniref:Uncharacterized protein n=1 Tax=Prunus persica TaxID=3760 RepID=A0A251PNK5_PRUPE|nr:hypothetical protein PRUPE_4G206500 [Prunus persica]